MISEEALQEFKKILPEKENEGGYHGNETIIETAKRRSEVYGFNRAINAILKAIDER